MKDLIKELPKDLLSRFTEDNDFNAEGLELYLESQFEGVEDYYFYIGIVDDTDLLGENKYTIENSPIGVLQRLMEMSKCEISIDQISTFRDYLEFMVVTEDGRHDSLHIIGVKKEDYKTFEVMESEGQDFLRFLVDHYTDFREPIKESALKVTFPIYEHFIDLLELKDVDDKMVDHRVFFGSLKSIQNKGSEELGFDYVRAVGKFGGYILDPKDWNILNDYAKTLAAKVAKFASKVEERKTIKLNFLSRLV